MRVIELVSSWPWKRLPRRSRAPEPRRRPRRAVRCRRTARSSGPGARVARTPAADRGRYTKGPEKMKLAETIDWIHHPEARALLKEQSIDSSFVTVYRTYHGPFENLTLLPILIGRSEIQAALTDPMWNRLYCSRRKPKLLCLKREGFLCKAFIDECPDSSDLAAHTRIAMVRDGALGNGRRWRFGDTSQHHAYAPFRPRSELGSPSRDKRNTILREGA